MSNQIIAELIKPISELLKARKKIYDAQKEFDVAIDNFNEANNNVGYDNALIDCDVLIKHGDIKVFLVVDDNGKFYEFKKTSFEYEVNF